MRWMILCVLVFFAASVMSVQASAETALTLTITNDETGEVLVKMAEKTEFFIDTQKNHVVVFGATLAAGFKRVPLYGATLKLHRGKELVSSWAINSPALSNVVPDSQPTAVPMYEADRATFELGYGYPEQKQP